MTARLSKPLPSRPLALTVVGPVALEVVPAARARLLPIARLAARRPAHSLRRARARRGDKALAALRTATARHPSTVRDHGAAGLFPAGGWISIRPRSGARYAGGWITSWPPSGSDEGGR